MPALDFLIVCATETFIVQKRSEVRYAALSFELSTARMNIRQSAKMTQTFEALCQQLCNSVQGGFLLQAYTQILGPGPAVSVVLTLEEDFCGKFSCSTNAKKLSEI